MRAVTGDLWEWHARGAIIAITTGAAVDKRGRSLMLRGCARQAQERNPRLRETLGSLIVQHGSHVFDLGDRIVSFPVETTPFENPGLGRIEQSCRELVELADYKGWQQIVVPRPGCGGGGLNWDEVRPVLERHFDQRFIVITAERP